MLNPSRTVARGDVLGQLRLHGPDDPHDPRRVPVRGGRRLQEGRGPLGGRAQPPRPREDAPHRLERAPPRRAHEPPRPRLEGGPARRPRRLRRDARLRLPRPLLRGQARHEGHRGGRRRGPALPGRVRGLPLLEDGSERRRTSRRTSRCRPPQRDSARTWTTGPPRSRRRRSPGRLLLPRRPLTPRGRLPPSKAPAPKPLAEGRRPRSPPPHTPSTPSPRASAGPAPRPSARRSSAS